MLRNTIKKNLNSTSPRQTRLGIQTANFSCIARILIVLFSKSPQLKIVPQNSFQGLFVNLFNSMGIFGFFEKLEGTSPEAYGKIRSNAREARRRTRQEMEKKRIEKEKVKDETAITPPSRVVEISAEERERYDKIEKLRLERTKAIEERNWEKEKQIREEMRRLGHKFKG